MEEPLSPLSPTETFCFDCHSEVSCFNQCCRDLNQFLTPYDILRLKKHFTLPAKEFLERYTQSHEGPGTGLPIITLKTEKASGFACPFLEASGCGVYENRPSSCRMYPLARMVTRSRENGQTSELFYLIKEEHCLGTANDRSWTTAKWVEDQGLSDYNKINDQLMKIIQLKNSLKPGPLDPKSVRLFHMACYDLDDFRYHVFEKGLLDDFGLDIDTKARIKEDDVALLEVGLSWIRQVLFDT
jgi:Fe-S-cluster containining protein